MSKPQFLDSLIEYMEPEEEVEPIKGGESIRNAPVIKTEYTVHKKLILASYLYGSLTHWDYLTMTGVDNIGMVEFTFRVLCWCISI